MTKYMIERPLILVPGIMESSLAVRKDLGFFGIWPLIPSGIPSSVFLDNILPDLGTNIRKSMDDNVSVVTTGLLPGAYDYIISAIIRWGYTLGNNFWIFPYDWRQSNKISGQMLTNFIKNKNLDGVDIILSFNGRICYTFCKKSRCTYQAHRIHCLTTFWQSIILL